MCQKKQRTNYFVPGTTSFTEAGNLDIRFQNKIIEGTKKGNILTDAFLVLKLGAYKKELDKSGEPWHKAMPK